MSITSEIKNKGPVGPWVRCRCGGGLVRPASDEKCAQCDSIKPKPALSASIGDAIKHKKREVG